MAIKLSPHFTEEEFLATSVPVPNVPNEAQLSEMRKLASEILEQVRALIGPMHVNSGFRSGAVNLIVDGQPDSQHTKGQAVDFVPLAVPTLKAFIRIMTSPIQFDQLIFEVTKDGRRAWIHISRSDHPRREVRMHGPWTSGMYPIFAINEIPSEVIASFEV